MKTLLIFVTAVVFHSPISPYNAIAPVGLDAYCATAVLRLESVSAALDVQNVPSGVTELNPVCVFHKPLALNVVAPLNIFVNVGRGDVTFGDQKRMS